VAYLCCQEVITEGGLHIGQVRQTQELAAAGSLLWVGMQACLHSTTVPVQLLSTVRHVAMALSQLHPFSQGVCTWEEW
jgi:hypothetical protein